MTRENQLRNEHNSRVLTDEVKAKLAQVAASDVTRRAVDEEVMKLGLKPLLDLSTITRDALAKRAHHTNTGHADPRTVWNPGVGDARMNNLGMGAHVPANVNVTRKEGK